MKILKIKDWKIFSGTDDTENADLIFPLWNSVSSVMIWIMVYMCVETQNFASLL